MRPALRWSLAITVLLSAAALIWPEPAMVPGSTGQASSSSGTIPAQPTNAAPTDTRRNGKVPTLPAHLPQQVMAAATFDPFTGVQAPIKSPAAPVPALTTLAVPAPTPTAPPLNYRYLGQILDPDGQRSVFLARADQHIAVKAGATLEEGYVVESVTAEAITLRHPLLDGQARISIPPSSPDR